MAVAILIAKSASTTAKTTRTTGKRIRTTPTSASNIMSCQHLVTVLLVILAGLSAADGLKCHMCGQYNEGVGSITPCLNYSDQYAHLYLKECTKSSEKFCVKYVSELSTVRDCATECVEKEIWETQTYCCAQDGCNGSSCIEITSWVLMMPLLYVVLKTFVSMLQVQR